MILEILVREVNGIIDYLESYLDKEILPEHFSTRDSHDEIIDNYNKLLEIAEDFENSVDERKKESYDVLLDKFNEMRHALVTAYQDAAYVKDFAQRKYLPSDILDKLNEIMDTASESLGEEN